LYGCYFALHPTFLIIFNCARGRITNGGAWQFACGVAAVAGLSGGLDSLNRIVGQHEQRRPGAVALGGLAQPTHAPNTSIDAKAEFWSGAK
jgi:hypothetical protein